MDFPRTVTKWSINFIKTIEHFHDDVYTINKGTPMEMKTYYRGDKETGVIDIFVGNNGHFQRIPTRIVEILPEKSVLYQFTLIKPPDMPNKEWQQGIVGLKEELGILKQILEK